MDNLQFHKELANLDTQQHEKQKHDEIKTKKAK